MIGVKDLSYSSILDSISFSLDEGKTLAVIGHNGAGKTTLFHVLLGLKFATTGEFEISETKYGFVPERPYLAMEESFRAFLTVHLNLISFPKNEQESEIQRVAQQVGLQDELHKKFKQFSKGMLQKSLIAQAMLGSPKLIFLDEPMSGLDPSSREETKKYLEQLKAGGVTLIFSSHVMEDVAALADQVLVLNQGKQTFFGSIQDWKRGGIAP